MEKILGEWIVYDYAIQIPSLEEVCTISFKFLEAENIIRTRIIKNSCNTSAESEEDEQEPEADVVSDDAIYNHEENNIVFSVHSPFGKTTTNVKFFSDKLFKGFSYDPIETSIATNFLVGMKKSEYNPFPDAKIFGKFSLTEYEYEQDGSENKVCTADIELKLKSDYNSLNSSEFPKVVGKYFNFISLLEEVNEEFSGGDYVIEGEVYSDDHVCFVIKFGDFNSCAHEMRLNEANEIKSIWYNLEADGVARGFKN